MSQNNFLQTPKPGGLAPLNPTPMTGSASATGKYVGFVEIRDVWKTTFKLNNRKQMMWLHDDV